MISPIHYWWNCNHGSSYGEKQLTSYCHHFKQIVILLGTWESDLSSTARLVWGKALDRPLRKLRENTYHPNWWEKGQDCGQISPNQANGKVVITCYLWGSVWVCNQLIQWVSSWGKNLHTHVCMGSCGKVWHVASQGCRRPCAQTILTYWWTFLNQ